MEKSNRKELIAECRSSGMTAKDWCYLKEIPYRQYISWVSRENRLAKSKIEPVQQPQWTAVNMPVMNKAEEKSTGGIRLSWGKWTIEVEKGSDLPMLGEVLRTVMRLC